MKRQLLNARDLVSYGIKSEPELPQEFEEEFTPSVPQKSGDRREIEVEWYKVEPLDIGQIVDSKGRLSDIVDSVATETGLAVIPFDMVGFSPEVEQLLRHDIFTIGGKKYAMLKKARGPEVKQYVEHVLQVLREGLPYQESLNILVTYKVVDYNTFRLSQVEWAIVLSMFRGYKQHLYNVDDRELILEVTSERTNV